MKKGVVLSAIMIISLLITACLANRPLDGSESDKVSETATDKSEIRSETENIPKKTGIIAEQILNGSDGEIHYSYYLPEDYEEGKTYPLIMTMPGYDMMWFGEDSSGSNLKWSGFQVWV